MNCFRNATLAATISFGLVSGANALPIIYTLDEDLKNIGPLQQEIKNVSLSGEITLDDTDLLDFGPSGLPFKPLPDFVFGLTYDIDLGNGLESVRIPITPNTVSVVLNGKTTRADENTITIDTSGVPSFTPLFDI